METGPDGKQRVKVFQPMPFTVAESINDIELLKKLLVANGMDIKEIEFSGKISAGMSQEVKLAVCHLNDGSRLDLLIKVNKEEAGMVNN